MRGRLTACARATNGSAGPTNSAAAASPLLASNTRFLLLPHKTVPNRASKTLRLVLTRLSAGWQARHGHPVLLVETFVDPAHFGGHALHRQRLDRTGPDRRHRDERPAKHARARRELNRRITD